MCVFFFGFLVFSGHPKENVDDMSLVEEIMSKTGFVNHVKRDDWRDFIRNFSKDNPGADNPDAVVVN